MTISIWLRETLMGIIVLGAIGSMLAVLIIRFLSYVFVKFFPAQRKRWSVRLFRFGRTHGYAVGCLLGMEDLVGLLGYFFYHATLALSLLIIACGSCLLATMLFAIAGSPFLTAGSYFCIMICMLSLYGAIRNFFTIFLFYAHSVTPHLKRGKDISKDVVPD